MTAKDEPKKQSLPSDPRDHYVYSTEKLSIRELADLYKGQKGCSNEYLEARCAKENWLQSREEFQRKLKGKTEEKILEKKAKSLADLNELDNEDVDAMRAMGKALLAQYISTDPKTGKKTITCKASEYRNVCQTITENIHTRRLLHNIEPNKPVSSADMGAPQGQIMALIDVINRSRK